MTDYAQITDFSIKDGLAVTDPDKVIYGSDFDGEFAAIETAVATKANLASPVLTGNPTAPTPAAADNDTSIPTTAWVQTELGDYAPLASPAFTGVPTTPTAAPGTDTTQVASTAFVDASFAPLASPHLTGTPTAPTASPGDNDTSIATTAFVTAAVAAGTDVTVTTGSFVPTWTGFSAAPSVTAYWTKYATALAGAADIVVIRFPNSFGTSNATGMSVTNLPAAITPATIGTGATMHGVQDNTVLNQYGDFSVNTSNTMHFLLAAVSGAVVSSSLTGFTASGTKGIIGQSLIYSMA